MFDRDNFHLSMDVSDVVSEVFRLYDTYGRTEYIGEEITKVEHSIQCAMHAESDGANDEAILAAFLHDIGHLIGMDKSMPSMTTDGRYIGAHHHDIIGGDFLRKLGFPSLVCDIVGGHVKAKRYLVYKYTDYIGKLSAASKDTLKHQGGAMTSSEADDFEKSAAFDTIIKMRSWDDLAKDKTVKTDDLDKYKQLCVGMLSAGAQ